MKSLQMLEGTGFATETGHERRLDNLDEPFPTPQGNWDGVENKGVAGKVIRKTMKTKGEQIGVAT